jgi:hypothetical protein
MLQLYNQGPSLMPYLYVNGEVITPFDCLLSQSLKLGYLPIPKVTWQKDKIVFSQEALAVERGNDSYIFFHYTITNKGKDTLRGKAFFSIRPFQVNPPWQWAGGMAKIENLSFRSQNNILKVNGVERIYPLKKPNGFDAVPYIEGDIIEKIKKGKIGANTSIVDNFGYGSGAFEYDFSLKHNQQNEYIFIISLNKTENRISLLLKDSRFKDIEAIEKNVINNWRQKLNKVSIEIPDKEMINTLKSSLAYILLNRDGPMLQAGAGAYEKSWIRDGCISSAALLRMGYTQEVREYVDWISKNIRNDGKVPPIMVSENKADPAWEGVYEEYDSQGQYIFSVLQYYHFTKDKQWLRGKLSLIRRVADCIKQLRQKNAIKNQPGYQEEFSGLLPLSVSHEGYFPPPGVHSYWDNFWGIKGLKDAQEIADILGDNDFSKSIKNEILDFRNSLHNSIKLVQQQYNIDYIPGCAERGDFDAPSAAIAVWPTEEAQYFPEQILNSTFKIFWNQKFSPTLENTVNWSYPSYALRASQYYIRYNQRDKAVKMLEQYLQLKRPRAWNQWAEGTLADDRKPWFIGDLPHSWVAAIYINSFRSLFVYEKDGYLLLAGGVPQKWIEKGSKVSIKEFPTYYGDISYSIIKKKRSICIEAKGRARAPRGFVLKLKFNPSDIEKVRLNDKIYRRRLEDGIFFESLPATIEIKYRENNKIN